MSNPALHQQVDEVFAAVADRLGIAHGGLWSWHPNPADWAPGGHLVEEKSGSVLYARISDRGPGSYTIRPESPRDSRGQVPYVISRNLPSINVSAAKSPARIAEDITRRLLPEWLPLLERALEAVAQSNQHQSAGERAIAELAQIAGVSPPREKGSKHLSFYGSPHEILSGGDAEVSGNEVRLSLRLTAQDAATLLHYLTRSS